MGDRYIIFADGTTGELKGVMFPKIMEGVPHFGMKIMPRESIMKKMGWTEENLDDDECVTKFFRAVDVKILGYSKIFIDTDIEGKTDYRQADEAQLKDQVVNLQKQINTLKNEIFTLQNQNSDLRNRIKKVMAEQAEIEEQFKPKVQETQPLPDYTGGGR